MVGTGIVRSTAFGDTGYTMFTPSSITIGSCCTNVTCSSNKNFLFFFSNIGLLLYALLFIGIGLTCAAEEGTG
jgi:hypothetical protein